MPTKQPPIGASAQQIAAYQQAIGQQGGVQQAAPPPAFEWSDMAKAAAHGKVRYKPSSAIDLASAVEGAIGRFQVLHDYVTRDLDMTDVPPLARSDLPSGQILADWFSRMGKEVQESLHNHIDLLTDMHGAVVAAGKAYVTTEDHHAQQFARDKTVLTALEHRSTPSDPNSIVLDKAMSDQIFQSSKPYFDAVGQPPGPGDGKIEHNSGTSFHAVNRVDVGDPYGNNIRGITDPSSGPNMVNRDLNSTDPAQRTGSNTGVTTAMVKEIPGGISDPHSSGAAWQEMWALGNHIRHGFRGGSIAQLCADLGAKYGWYADTLDQIFSDYTDQSYKILHSGWETKYGSQAVTAAIKKHHNSIEQLRMNMNVIQRNLQYASGWLDATQQSMPTSPTQAEHTMIYADPGSGMTTAYNEPSAPDGSDVETYRKNLQETYIKGAVASSGQFTTMPNPLNDIRGLPA